MDSTELITSCWSIRDSSVVLVRRTADVVRVPALDIFDAAFRKSFSYAGERFRSPQSDLPSIRFSRKPARPAVRICGTEPVDLTFEFGLVLENEFIFWDGSSDQIVHSEHWYPIRGDEIKAARGWLRNSGFSESGNLTIGNLVLLRAQADLPFSLLDEVVIDPSTKFNSQIGKIEGFEGQLYRYQSAGVSYLSAIASQDLGCILGDEMGLGKTAQVIALLLMQHTSGRGPNLVIAPSTLLENWRREIATFSPTSEVLIHAGANRAGVAARLNGVDIVVTSYETAVRDEEILNQIYWNVLVLDEAQAIKNPLALRTITVKRLPRRVSIAVTGTPLENRIDDLWSIADFAVPGMLGELNSFLSSFGNRIDDAVQIAPIVAPILLRRKVAEVANDLPERIEISVALQMSEVLAEEYESLRKSTLSEFGPAGGLVATTRLRMICAHPMLVGSWQIDPAHEVPKYQRTVELLEEIFANGEKALVFSTYQAIADIFILDMPKRFPEGFFHFIDGRVDVIERQSIVDDFFNHNGFGALFLNPKAAGSGLNITAANHVIHYNPEWNPALTAQASARSYRRKQEKPVTIYHLFYANTIEEIIRETAIFKQELAEEAVVGNDGNLETGPLANALLVSPLMKNRS